MELTLQRNADLKRGITLKDSDGDPLDLTGATFDMDFKFNAGDAGPPLASGTIIPSNLPEGYFEIHLSGSTFNGIGNSHLNTILVFDLLVTQDGHTVVAVEEGKLLLKPGVSDNAA